jgi:hypothetical protein
MSTSRLRDNAEAEQPPPSHTRAPLEEIAVDRASTYGHRLTIWGRRNDDQASLILTVTERGPRVMLAELRHSGGVLRKLDWLPGIETEDLGDERKAILETWTRSGIAAWHAEAGS